MVDPYQYTQDILKQYGPGGSAYEGGRKLPEPGNPKKVFVSHGHDDKAKGDVQSFLETKGLEPIILADQPARETAELLLLVGRLVQTEGYDGELSPAQWMALRYFARANTFSRTPSAFAEVQATTRGTASQAIKALEAGGYSVRQRSKADGRSVSLRLTSKGKKALARDPFEVLVRAVDLLDAKERTAMHHALHQVLTTLAAS